MQDLKSKAAIVTGSATGVGAATAKLLAAQGCNVVVNYTKSKAEAEETMEACRAEGVKSIAVQANVAEDDDCRKLVDACIGEFGRLDHLVNNAGTTKFVAHSDLDGLDADDFRWIYSVNVVGPYQMIKHAAPHMRKNGGSVTNVSSIAGVTGLGSCVAYAASKGALNTMTLSLARALGPEIRVNAICPGMIQGKWLREGMGEDRYDGFLQHQLKTNPLQKVSTPEDNARAILMFIQGSDLITGETLLVDGGYHLGFAPTVAR
ncbi:SDR family NAD(P)-dependent oxidoreductase [Minwuia thermotolerans]|uniref:Oxidoreductase n=1 Tax=Minwuia thermotolerans TaxID=2056226 RepID=A0A2M9FXG0_9PROT|nr:SDR family oxidoreductase [Minwuia thermotolerans]PJK28143.1 oxidoreductase [Minwuia thermotolerans]